ncbi:hypothetical protein H8I69_18590 [Serratia fonticola]|uniref:hypothetical protein n=1 Tax=Serratia fonticola TaxID=47917 RepID=UPI0015C5EF12|nr:hypothetical protein [Serratia fonticola]MBC3381132.1 hypothetical protein [Serratia fonticola]NYA40331.1 hypothetical protein [Serratia fonticola]
MKIKIAILMFALITGVFLGDKFSHKKPDIIGGRCYVFVKSSYHGGRGGEHLNSVISFTFSKTAGAVTVNTVLTTADNDNIPLSQSLIFNLSAIEHDKYTINIINKMNKSLSDSIPENLSPYMKNIISNYLTNPEIINLRIVPLKESGYLIYSNLIPWAYCNSF